MRAFYTAWLYGPTTKPHCTHKYLGPLDADQVAEILLALKRGIPSAVPFLYFDKPDTFQTKRGPVRVLLSSDWESGKFDIDPGWLFLRDELGAIARLEDEYPFRPHVTTEGDAPTASFSYFALCSGRDVLVSYRINVLPEP